MSETLSVTLSSNGGVIIVRKAAVLLLETQGDGTRMTFTNSTYIDVQEPLEQVRQRIDN